MLVTNVGDGCWRQLVLLSLSHSQAVINSRQQYVVTNIIVTLVNTYWTCRNLLQYPIRDHKLLLGMLVHHVS